MGGDWLLLPVRPFADGKRRLAGALPPAEIAMLGERLFGHVFGVACAAVGAARCAVVTRDSAIRGRVRAAGALAIAEPACGLNEALTHAAARLFDAGAARVTALHCDLPLLAADDVAALLAAEGEIALAPDAAGTGTNALRIAAAGAIPYRFGVGSRAAHAGEARARGLDVAVVERRGLGCDLDLPADLALLG